MNLELAFAPFFETVLPTHGFTPVEGSCRRSGMGLCEDFKNGDFRIRLIIDRRDHIVNLSRTFENEGWLLAERVLSYLSRTAQIEWTVSEIADGINARYDSLRSFFKQNGFLERRLEYKRFAIEQVSQARPHWHLEKTDRWKELQRKESDAE